LAKANLIVALIRQLKQTAIVVPVSGSEFRVPGFEFRVSGSEFFSYRSFLAS